MSVAEGFTRVPEGSSSFRWWGVLWFVVAILGAAAYFSPGLDALLSAWASPEYSHGPLIPILSLFLFLRQLKTVPINSAPVTDHGAGIAVLVFALLLGAVGRASHFPEFAAYATIFWIGGMILVSFGWRDGKQFWPPVLHLIYMLPLPSTLYYGLSTYLQGVSSELGVWMLRMIDVPVFQDGNIIDLGVYKLHVAEACSGLRYLFPILSFSYIFAVLYRGPLWHKVILLVSAVPITVVMNSVRIAIAGAVVDHWGLDFVEGLTHFMEGWVIFITCVLILFSIAWLLLRLHPEKHGLVEALDLETSGLGPQARRIGLIQPSRTLIGAALVVACAAAAWHYAPRPASEQVQHKPFYLFPRDLGAWRAGPPQRLDPNVAQTLAATDYYGTSLTNPVEGASVDLFIAWYQDQTRNGAHSPTICLPGSGWEIAKIGTTTATTAMTGEAPFSMKRVIIQKGLQRMLVYYWFQQAGGIRTASSYYSKFMLVWTQVTMGRSDGALVRLITPIAPGETVAAADARLQDALRQVLKPLPKFVPE